MESTMRLYFLSVVLIISSVAAAQRLDTGMCITRPAVRVAATINNIGFIPMVHITRDSLQKGFTVTLSDLSYKVFGFRVYFYGKYADIYWKDIEGNRANEANLPVLKSLIGDEWMEIECISITKNKKTFTAIPFKIWIYP
jgi:hypothetical protein